MKQEGPCPADCKSGVLQLVYIEKLAYACRFFSCALPQLRWRWHQYRILRCFCTWKFIILRRTDRYVDAFYSKYFRLTDKPAFNFELSSNFFHWIARKIARASTSLPINWKFRLSDSELSRLDCISVADGPAVFSYLHETSLWVTAIHTSGTQRYRMADGWHAMRGHPRIVLGL